MPEASEPLPPQKPATLTKEEESFIVETVRRFYGDNAVVRNFGPDPDRIDLHVEAEIGRDMTLYDCLGVLLTRIDRAAISLEITKRGSKVYGPAKIAYRQGVIL